MILKLPHKVNSLIIFRKKPSTWQDVLAQEYFKLNIYSQINVLLIFLGPKLYYHLRNTDLIQFNYFTIFFFKFLTL